MTIAIFIHINSRKKCIKSYQIVEHGLDLCYIELCSNICKEELIMNEDYMDKWISIDEAAEYLGVNKDTIRNWIKKDSSIPANKIGKQWRFKRSELDTWVKNGQSAID